MDEKNIFYLGLDIGTDSCGWALTDENYNVVRKHGKKAWGVRLFDNALVAQDRRQKRTARRRIQRKRLQTEWLKEVFADEVEKKDAHFFDRLKYSNLLKEDKEARGINGKYSLFNDILKEVYTDREYYKKYKSVYHLRKELLEKPADDVRLLYLAVHSFLTHRGHFLYEITGTEQKSETDKGMAEMFNDVIKNLNEEIADEKSFNLKKTEENVFEKLFTDFKDGLSLKQIKENFIEGIQAETAKEKNIAKIIISGKFKLKDLFDIAKEDKEDIDFSSEKYETETLTKIEEFLKDDEKVAIIEELRNIYNTLLYKKLLGDKDFICEAMVEKYTLHHEQLAKFKKFVKKYYPSKTSYVFRKVTTSDEGEEKTNKGKGNYAEYIYQTLTGGKKHVIKKKVTKEEFYKFVKDLLNEEPEIGRDEEFEEEKSKIIALMEKGEFLQKIRSHDNIVLPNSLYLNELKKILDVSAEKFAFLKAIDDDTGLSGKDKIIEIIKFKVPYYVGPIGDAKGEGQKFGWAEKKCDMSLRPWNLEKIIDLNETEDKFIERMTNKCTYLKDKDVLPDNSLLYSKYKVLNELNNLRINGNPISVKNKQSIFNELFKKEKKVTVKKLKEFLKRENIIPNAEECVVEGIDKEFANNLASFVTFSSKFKEEFIEEHFDVFETIIKYHTIIQDKKRLEERITREFGNIFSPDEIKWLKSLNFSKWGKFSKEFLKQTPFSDKRKQEKLFKSENFSGKDIEKLCNGEVYSVIEALWETNNNLQQLFDRHNYTLQDEIDSSQKKFKKDIDIAYDDIEIYCSPAVKRGAWQAIKIVKEIRQAIGKYPDKIFVEVTRHDEKKGEKGRKDSRKKKLDELYKKIKSGCKGLSIDYNKLMDDLNKKDVSDLRSERLFLYFLQLGKCMYTGEPIDIADLDNDNKYDIDHIIPQSKIKDDSLDNKVLVKKSANFKKGAQYPIEGEWQSKQRNFWHMLKDKEFLSEKKLSRLERTEPFNEQEEFDFINRQLVDTNQTSKAVIELLRKVVDNERNVIFSKACIVSDFRNKYKIYKSREVNCFHHAKDAYLNIVVGNVIYNRFTARWYDKEKKDDRNTLENVTRNYSKIFDGKVFSHSGNTLVWNNEEMLPKVKKQCERNDCIVSVMPYILDNGGFYDETIYKSKKNDEKTKASFPLKGDGKVLSDIDKYGGYNSLKNAYFMVVESEKKGKIKKTIEAVPIIINYKYRKDPDKVEKIKEYLEKENGIKITKVILPMLKIKSTLKIDDGFYTLNGKTGNSLIVHRLNQWYINNKNTGYIKVMEKYLAMDDDIKKGLKKDEDSIIVSPKRKDNSREQKISREENIALYDLVIEQLGKKIYNLNHTVVEILKNKREKFISLEIGEQTKLLNNIVLYVGGAYSVDLTSLGGANAAGKTTINKDITSKEIKIILQTSAGLTDKEIKL